MKHPAPLAFVFLCSAIAACADDPPPGPTPPAFELRAVVDPALAALEAELAATEEDVEPVPAEDVRGLLQMIASSTGSMRGIALEEAAGFGAAAVDTLAAAVADAEASWEERVSALEVLGAIDTPGAAMVLLEHGEMNEDPSLRAHALWRLGEGTQDWVVPRLVLRLKYEDDHDAVIWLGRTLAHYGNFAGLGGLQTVAFESPDAGIRASAQARIEEILAETGFEDPLTLSETWQAGDPDDVLSDPARSPRFDREVWARLARLREFQLRGVDDTRWICSSLDAHTAEILIPALHDADYHTRTGVAQCLERMGPRAAVAVDELIAGLADPMLGPGAANALGAIGDARAEAPLLVLVDSPTVAYGLRLAAVRALGGLGADVTARARTRLRELFDARETAELFQAAGESLVLLGEGGLDLPLALADLIVSPEVEPVSSERVLRLFLARRTVGDDEEARKALADWDDLALDKDRILEPHEGPESRAGRRAIVRELLGFD